MNLDGIAGVRGAAEDSPALVAGLGVRLFDQFVVDVCARGKFVFRLDSCCSGSEECRHEKAKISSCHIVQSLTFIIVAGDELRSAEHSLPREPSQAGQGG